MPYLDNGIDQNDIPLTISIHCYLFGLIHACEDNINLPILYYLRLGLKTE
jgi:hypothetical protein